MNAIGNNLFFLTPLALLAAGICVLSGVRLLRAGRAPRAAVLVGRSAMIVHWILALVLVPVGGFGDWLHMYWAVQVPLLGLFLGSGVLGWGRRPSWPFFVATATLALFPLLLVSFFPEAHVDPREIGAPARGLWDLARWGLGGPLPAWLEPSTSVATARGVDYLPRVITSTFGTTLIMAWLWIAFAFTSVLARLPRWPHERLGLRLILPPTIGLAVVVLAAGGFELGPFEAGFFAPLGSRDSGIWTSEPGVMRSYGPVLLTALLSATLLIVYEARRARGLPSRGLGGDSEGPARKLSRGTEPR